MFKLIIAFLFINFNVYAAYQPDVSATVINSVANPVPVNIVSGTINVSTSGTATAANQVIGNGSLSNIDGSLAQMALAIGVSGSSVPFYSYFMSGSDGTNAHNLKTDTAGVLAVSTTGINLESLMGVSTTSPLNVRISGVSSTDIFRTSIMGVSTTSSLPVTGTFWQTTQPVSIASTLVVSATGNSTVNQGTSPWVTSISGQPLFSLGGVSTTGILSVSQSGNVGVNQVSAWSTGISGVSTTAVLSVSTTGINLDSLQGVSTTSPLNVRISAVSSTDIFRSNIQAVSTTDVLRTNIQGISTTVNVQIASVSTTGILNTSLMGVSTTSILSVSATGNSAVNQNGIWSFGLNAVSTTAALNTAITSVSTSGLFNTSLLGVSTTSALNTNSSISGVSTTSALNSTISGVSTTAVLNSSILGVSTTSILNSSLLGVSTTSVLNAANFQAGSAVGGANPLFVSIAAVSTSTALPVSFSAASFSIAGVSTTSALNNNISGVSTTAILNSSILGVSTTSVMNVSGTVAGLSPASVISSLPIPGIDAGNSSTATLGGNATFTGTYYDAAKYTNVTVNVSTDVTSAADGLKLQYSSDGTNLDSQDMYTIPAGGGAQYSAVIGTRYFRIVYVNGAGAQSAFRLQTKYHTSGIKPSSVRLADSQTDQADVPIEKAVIAGISGTTTTNVFAPNNALAVSQTNIAPDFVSTSTVSSTDAIATSFTLRLANTSRTKFEILNKTDQTCWFLKSSSAVTSSTGLVLLANTGYYFETKPVYTGQVNAICASASGVGKLNFNESP